MRWKVTLKKAMSGIRPLVSIPLFTLVLTAVGVFFVVVELSLARFDRSVDQTLSFAERFNSQAMIQARQLVQKPLLAYEGVLSANESGLNDEQIALLGAHFIEVDREKSGELLDSVLLITTFFDQLSTCIQFSCNADVACQYFSTTAVDFRLLYGRALENMAKGLEMKGIGYGLYDPKLIPEEGEKCRNPESWPLYFALFRH